MRDCVVVGCGRSGTSLAAGLLARAGYNCGKDLLPPDEGGPAGFFESRGVNAINEAVLPPEVKPTAPAELRVHMAQALPAPPYCCKDPRFAYTLEAWGPLFAGALFVCVFRH